MFEVISVTFTLRVTFVPTVVSSGTGTAGFRISALTLQLINIHNVDTAKVQLTFCFNPDHSGAKSSSILFDNAVIISIFWM